VHGALVDILHVYVTKHI